ncbi:hypothetical protein GGI21_004534, partial [Coemansia aciculifera]
MYGNDFNRRGRDMFSAVSFNRGRTPRSYLWSWKSVPAIDRNYGLAIADFANQHARFIEGGRNIVVNRMIHLLSTIPATELEYAGYAMTGLHIVEQCSTDNSGVEITLESTSEDNLLT